MIKIKINSLDEAAKWRSTGFKPEWTREEIEEIDKKYDDKLLFVHFDDGVSGSSGLVQPQTTFNPQTTYNTPIGIYTYPWEYAKNKIFNDSLPFAQDKQFLYIYKAKNKSKIFEFEAAADEGVFQDTISKVIDYKSPEEILTALKASGLSDNNASDLLSLFYEESPKNKKYEEFIKEIKDTSYQAAQDYIFDEGFSSESELAQNNIRKMFERLFESFTTKFFNLPEIKDEKTLTKIDKEVFSKMVASMVSDIFPTYTLKETMSGWIRNTAPRRGSLVVFSEILVEMFNKDVKGREFKNPNSRPLDQDKFDDIVTYDKYAKRWFYFINNINDKNPVKVTKFFQDLGIGILSDSGGEGIIHSAEPTQAIIFNPAYADLIGVKTNPSLKRADIGGVKAASQQRLDTYNRTQATHIYSKLSSLTGDSVNTKDYFAEVAQRYIGAIFRTEDYGEFNKEPSFAKKHFKKIISLNNIFVNYFLIQVLENNWTVHDDDLLDHIKTYVVDDLKDQLYHNYSNYNKKINELADIIFNNTDDISVLKILKKHNGKQTAYNVFPKHYEQYEIQEVKDAIDIVFEKLNKQDSINESKKLLFKKDGRNFKLLR